MESFDYEHDYVGVIADELLECIKHAPMLQPKDLYIEEALENLFGNYNWSKSFSRTQILVYDEVLPSEILIALHKWLRKKCADIENVKLIITHHTGIQSWWRKWCQVHQERSFSIQEIFYTNRPRLIALSMKWINDPQSVLKDTDFYLKQKNILKLFSYYGGSYTTREREYALLRFLKFQSIANIDFLADLASLQEILDYTENITYYKNQKEIDQISETYKTLLNNNFSGLRIPESTAVKLEEINFLGFQWHTDRHCWASVIRETHISEKYSCVTEKTIRTFLHHCVAIPIGFQAVDDLEQLGFWFPHELIDYSYQYEDLFSNRISKLITTLDSLTLIPLIELQKNYIDNIDKFQYNANLVYKLYSTNPKLRF
jgi:hypothetical protein